MNVDWMMLANHAEVPPNGLLYVSGGAWDSVNVTQPLPDDAPEGVVALLQGVLIVRLSFHATECDIDHPFRLTVVDEDGADVGTVDGHIRAEREHDIPPGWPQPANIIVSLTGLPLPRIGLYTVNLRINNEHKGDRPFRVVKRY